MTEPLGLDAIQARLDAATPGPWRWRGNTESRHLRLQTPHHGGLTVMDFERWGMQGAQPRFARDHLMYPANEMVTYEVAAWSKDIYRKDIVGIEHPDAEFIAAARQDVPALLARVRELEAERDRYRTAWHSARRRASLLHDENATWRRTVTSVEQDRDRVFEHARTQDERIRALEVELATAKAAGYRQAADHVSELILGHGKDADAEMVLVFLQNGADLRERFAASQAAPSGATQPA
ncbi:hypothetical protein [Kitasatospora sp. NPDC091276]|uniref:hypothetical protein n=1 Tax=unclassified Kitasatospora TaxID=2633591 RepID=UPI00343FE97C